MKRIFNKSNLFGTITIFLVVLLIQQIMVRSKFLYVFEKALIDYNVTDLVFSKLRDLDTPVEEDIVIVNTGNLSRADIAVQIHLIAQHNPKVIGINQIFEPSESFLGDSLLVSNLAKVKNLVMLSTTKHNVGGENVWDTLVTSDPKKYANLGLRGCGRVLRYEEENAQFKTWRTVFPSRKMNTGQEEKCFASQIIELYNPEIAKRFYARDNEEENIHFRGNLDKFIKLDADDVFDQNFVPEMITGKIVLFGYMGNSYNSSYWSGDKFYTPMNTQQVGRGIPDTYGVVVQANIISMLLHEEYINEMPRFLSTLIAIIVCYFNVTIFTMIINSRNYGLWYDLISKIIQLIEVVIAVWIIITVFSTYRIKLDLTIMIFVILLSGDIMEIYLSLVVNATYETRLWIQKKKRKLR